MKFLSFLLLSLSVLALRAQVVNTGFVDTAGGEHLGKITLGACVDVYANSSGAGNTLPYMVSSANNNTFAVNLAMLDIRYQTAGIRARLVPAFGTYMNANLANEPGTLKNLLEASVGVRLSKKHNLWMDAGILGSPYTNENPVSKDQIMYTRSLSAENSPYYLSGVKLGLPLRKNVRFYTYIINGWQQIQDNNAHLALGTQLEWQVGKNHLINWNTYIGNEESQAQPQFDTRFFTDLYWIGRFGKKWDASVCVYAGRQRYSNYRYDSLMPPPDHGSFRFKTWWNANAQLKYAFTSKISLSGRVEWFSDGYNIFQTPLYHADKGYRTGSYGFCLNRKVEEHALLRLEYRRFFTNSDAISIYPFDLGYRDNLDVVSVAMCVWF
ncbi:MAG: porin [Sphingomonadales bacterium]|nr:porin [Sphingomonadales bacterium]